MEENFERPYDIRMLYSPESHESLMCSCKASVIPPDGMGFMDAYSPRLSCGTGRLSSRRGAQGNAVSEVTQIFGIKESQSIGMARGYPLFISKLSTAFHFGRLAVLAVLCSVLIAGTSAHAQSASSWNKQGQAAELREDYDTAYECYLKAHEKNPKDMRYSTRVDRMRFQAAASHVDRGRVLRQNGDYAGALNQFSRALQIDPGNEAAAQEIAITQRADKEASAAGAAGAVSEANVALHDIASISAPIELKPLSDEPITLHMIEDSKNIYLAIGKFAGLNVLFDPDYTSRRIPVDLTSVSVPDALRIVGAISGTFYKEMTPDTIFVAQNNRQKHTDLDNLAVQTFYLTNPSQASDANEVYTALRNMLPADTKSYLVPSQNAIIVRGTTDDLILAQKLLNDLDRTKAEVVVDVAILEVNRDKVRNLGITLPQSVTITPQQTPTAAGTTTTLTTNNNNFTLNTLANINSSNFAVTVGSATVNALLTDADTRVLQNPSIRATDGQNAKLKIGSKIPVATGSYSAGAATGITAGIGVQTQFTYLDVGVNIDLTPTIHLDREVSMKLTVEVLSQTNSVTISGVTEPIIGQRSSTSTIQLRDGEPCLLAGILTKEENATSSGTPGIASVPILKYFFGSNFKESLQDEIVFILIPHIVRESVLTRLNTRAIDTGTSTDIQLRRDANPVEALFPDSTHPPAPVSTTTAAQAASGMVQQMKQQAMPPTPGSTTPTPGSVPKPAAPRTTANTPGADAVSGQPVTLTVIPPISTQTLGSTFQASVVLSNAHDVYSVPLQLQFDPKVLQLVNVDAGGLLGGDGQPVALVHRDEGNGLVTVSASRPPGVNGVNGQGQVCIFTFKAVAAGDSKLSLVKVGAKNSIQANLPATGSQAVVHVK
jgi:general secretion pathway protein D